MGNKLLIPFIILVNRKSKTARYLACLLFFLPMLSFAKDPCSLIKRHRDDLRGFTSYMSPDAPIVATKWLAADTTLSITFMIKSQAEEVIVTKGLYVEFDDGTFFRNDTVVIDKVVVAGKQIYSYRLILDRSGAELFTSKIVKQFGLGGLTQKGNATTDKLPEFINCMVKQNQ